MQWSVPNQQEPVVVSEGMITNQGEYAHTQVPSASRCESSDRDKGNDVASAALSVSILRAASKAE